MAPAATPSTPARPAPVVDLRAKPANSAAVAATKPAKRADETVPIAAGGALALLAIGGAAFAITRRRHEEGEDWATDEPNAYDEPARTTAAAEPLARDDRPRIYENQPAIVAPEVSAFAWGNEPRPDDRRAGQADESDDRRPGETWIERAYRGPSPGNPSVSLRARLKRAAFFDKRERDVAAGLAQPVDTDAGLPDAMVEDQERELA